jgi:hypothetical protein
VGAVELPQWMGADRRIVRDDDRDAPGAATRYAAGATRIGGVEPTGFRWNVPGTPSIPSHQASAAPEVSTRANHRREAAQPIKFVDARPELVRSQDHLVAAAAVEP